MLILITKPSVEPVTLAEIKTRFDIDYDDHNSFLTNAIAAARSWVERRTGRALVQQTWELRQDCFEAQIELPKRPTRSIESVSYIDDDGDTVTLDAEDYIFIDGGDDSASMLIAADEWPTDLYDRPDAVRIQFVAGYAESDDSPADYAANVPGDIKEAIRQYVGAMYEVRENVVLLPTRQELAVTPGAVDALIAPYIVPRL